MMDIDGAFGDNISWTYHVGQVMEEPNVYYVQDGTFMFKDSKDYIKTDTDKSEWKALDCGCHVGRWADVLKKYGFKYTGVDQCERALEECRKNRPNNEWVHCALWDMSFKEEFDMVFTVAVLQHNLHAEQEKIIPRMYDALKPGGILFITESTLEISERTGRSQRGWIDLCERHGFKFIKFFKKNPIGIEDHYLFIKEKK